MQQDLKILPVPQTPVWFSLVLWHINHYSLFNAKYTYKQFYFKQFNLALVQNLVLFDPEISPYQVLPLRIRVDRGAMPMKDYLLFPKDPALLEPHHRIV